MISKLSTCAALLVCTFLFLFIYAPKAEGLENPAVFLISEVQTGGLTDVGAEDSTMEFIELHNASSDQLLLEGWKVQYLSASGQTVTDVVELTGILAAESYLLLGYDGYLPGASLVFGQGKPTGVLAKSGGHVRLIDQNGVVFDQLGWGTASQPEQSPISVISAGSSAERYRDCVTGFAVDTNNNNTDFVISSLPTPGVATTKLTDNCPVEEEPLPDEGGIGGALTCEDIIISEILPNPAGNDIGQEFIELHNPTNENISLEDCSLQTSAGSKIFTFTEILLQSGEYAAFYDSETGLSLPNAAGGTVWLLSPTDEIQAISYEANLADNRVWALIDGIWLASYAPTPDVVNVLLAQLPCSAGQVRSDESGQCKNIITTAAATMVSCREGQERNLATNRCRAISAPSSSLVPCRQDQERNPETNRCRSIIETASALQPCDEGEERNPDTNRCRKASVVAGTATPDVKDVYAGSVGANPRWWLAGLVFVAAVGYGVYEWRREVLGFLRRFTNRY